MKARKVWSGHNCLLETLVPGSGGLEIATSHLEDRSEDRGREDAGVLDDDLRRSVSDVERFVKSE